MTRERGAELAMSPVIITILSRIRDYDTVSASDMPKAGFWFALFELGGLAVIDGVWLLIIVLLLLTGRVVVGGLVLGGVLGLLLVCGGCID